MGVSSIVAGYCNANACADNDFMAVKFVRRPNGSNDSRRQNGAIFRLVDCTLQDSKLVTAETSDNITATDAMSETVCNNFQESVSGVMAQSVVHIFETIEIKAKDCNRRRSRLHVRKRFHQLL